MKYTKLGRTGLDCSVLGFGTWQIGGGRWKALDLKKSIELLQCATEIGINIFDAAIVYGQYNGALNEKHSHSLELLGKAFKGSRRNEIIICLKVGQLDEYSHKTNFEPQNLVDNVLKALKQLRTDYIDICLIHAPTISQIEDKRALSILQTLQALGIVRFIGYSFESEPVHANLSLKQNVDVIMLQYNLIEESCRDIFQEALSLGIGVLVGGPFKRGYLTGNFENLSDLPLEDNYWAWNIRYAKEKVQSLLSVSKRLKDEVGGALQLRQKALYHIIKNEGANSIIVGHRLKEEVIENSKSVEEIINKMNLSHPLYV